MQSAEGGQLNWGLPKMFWTARDLVPRDQRPALAAAITERQQIARVQ